MRKLIGRGGVKAGQLTGCVRQSSAGAQGCHEAGMGHLEEVDVLSKFGNVMETILRIWLRCCACRAEYAL